MLKIQICWSILRHFDYNDQLEIKNVGDTFIIRYEEGESLELAPQALNFLHKAYTFAQKTRGEKESPMEKLF